MRRLPAAWACSRMREELEDLAFRVLNPEGRASIIRRFITLQRETGDVIQRITGDMRTELAKAKIEAEVFGRAKKPYSVWRKMEEKEQSFGRLSDIYGFRVIAENEEDCYRALGAIHQRWRAVPGRFKDYISQPKSNGYRSIHTTVPVGTANGSKCRSEPARCMMWPKQAWRRIGPTATGCGRETPLPWIRPSGFRN
jgi:Guanosine polyphosphate pyrophosphohydrolases/synthetases